MIWAGTATMFGFTYLILNLTFISFLASPSFNFPLLKTTNEQSSIEVQCATDPEKFNITHLWQCSKFNPDSLAEQCATDPEKFDMKISECSQLYPRLLRRKLLN